MVLCVLPEEKAPRWWQAGPLPCKAFHPCRPGCLRAPSSPFSVQGLHVRGRKGRAHYSLSTPWTSGAASDSLCVFYFIF